ncbi:MAG: transposase [Puniceicoccales bacterium]|jgi:REP element-mobilizing transposase RayT|nr:transposase [Puniceicoccales bacterium]
MHPDRRLPAHLPPVDVFNRTTLIFLTVCTKDRKPILAKKDVVALLLDAWQQSAHWKIGRYVILPDHIHLFCAPALHDPLPLKRWVNFWKNLTTRQWPNEEEKPVWQKDYWDTQLRKGDSYGAKWKYVQQNPVRHRLVSLAEDWPWQGELNSLQWHE